MNISEFMAKCNEIYKEHHKKYMKYLLTQDVTKPNVEYVSKPDDPCIEISRSEEYGLLIEDINGILYDWRNCKFSDRATLDGKVLYGVKIIVKD